MNDHEAAVPLEAKSPFELRVDLSKNATDLEVKAALASGDLGYLHSFTTGSCVDGPGVRVVAWLTGCHFRCVYCHNPDTWKMKNGMPVTLAAARAELAKYRHGLKVMKGGLTISGGEPLLQDRFVVKFFSAAQELGVHTTLDTNGYLGNRLSDDELAKIDLVMLCLKSWDPLLHDRLTGMDGTPSREFCRRLAARKRPMWIRWVIVPGLTDSTDELKAAADFAAELGNVERIDLLPFHQLGAFKWERLGMSYTLKDVAPPSEACLEQSRNIFRAAGLYTP